MLEALRAAQAEEKRQKQSSTSQYVWDNETNQYVERRVREIGKEQIEKWASDYQIWQSEEEIRVQREIDRMRKTGVSESTLNVLFKDELAQIANRRHCQKKMDWKMEHDEKHLDREYIIEKAAEAERQRKEKARLKEERREEKRQKRADRRKEKEQQAAMLKAIAAGADDESDLSDADSIDSVETELKKKDQKKRKKAAKEAAKIANSADTESSGEDSEPEESKDKHTEDSLKELAHEAEIQRAQQHIMSAHDHSGVHWASPFERFWQARRAAKQTYRRKRRPGDLPLQLMQQTEDDAIELLRQERRAVARRRLKAAAKTVLLGTKLNRAASALTASRSAAEPVSDASKIEGTSFDLVVDASAFGKEKENKVTLKAQTVREMKDLLGKQFGLGIDVDFVMQTIDPEAPLDYDLPVEKRKDSRFRTIFRLEQLEPGDFKIRLVKRIRRLSAFEEMELGLHKKTKEKLRKSSLVTKAIRDSNVSSKKDDSVKSDPSAKKEALETFMSMTTDDTEALFETAVAAADRETRREALLKKVADTDTVGQHNHRYRSAANEVDRMLAQAEAQAAAEKVAMRAAANGLGSRLGIIGEDLSQYNGVKWDKDKNKWKVVFTYKGQVIQRTIGYFDDEKEAALAYDKTVRTHYEKEEADEMVNFGSRKKDIEKQTAEEEKKETERAIKAALAASKAAKMERRLSFKERASSGRTTFLSRLTGGSKTASSGKSVLGRFEGGQYK